MGNESITSINSATTKTQVSKAEESKTAGEKSKETASQGQSVMGQYCGPCPQALESRYYTSAMSGINDIFAGMDPIYGGSFPPGCGMMGGAGMGMGMGYGAGMGYGPGSETMRMTQKELYEYQNELKGVQIQGMVNDKKRMTAANYEAGAAENQITRAIAVLSMAITNNEQDHVMPLYQKLENSVRAKLYESGVQDAPEEQVKAEAERLYQEKTGKSVTEDLAQNGDGPLWHGFKKGLTFGLLSDSRNVNQNIAAITGEPESKTSITQNWMGQTGGVLAGGGLLAGFVALGVQLFRHLK